MANFDKDRTINAVLYILGKLNGVSDMHKIFKILFFADRMHLSKYGRNITSDEYIAMQFGPVPSKTDDIFKAVRGDSYFSDSAADLKTFFHFTNKYMVKADKEANTDYLSESDMECLDYAINLCRDLTFAQICDLSHGLAWQNTSKDREISIKDILREIGDTEEYVQYIAEKQNIEAAKL